MFEAICALIPKDPECGQRAWTLDILQRVLNGTLYDVLPFDFHEERNQAGEYVPLKNRRPSVRYPLSRIVVEDSVSLLFGDGHFPTITCDDPDTQDALAEIVRDSHLAMVMTEAAIRGSVGTIAVLMRVLSGRIFFDVLDTRNLAPVWDPKEPDTLLRVTERYKVSGRQLLMAGYVDCNPDDFFWFQRIWDKAAETWYLPVAVGANTMPVIDQEKSVPHDLGFVPIVWIKNLPGPSATGDLVDGACSFRAAVETQIEIDYQLSQAGRGLKYSSDPTLLLKEPLGSDSDIIKGAGNALVVGEHGDARLLEIGGTAAGAVIDYVRVLREFALESIHGNRASPERLTAPQSGRALELMNLGLIWLADNLRLSYGEFGIISLTRMVVQASQKYALRTRTTRVSPMKQAALLSLKWPRWYPSSATDRNLDASTLVTLMNAKMLSRDSAVKAIADTYDIDTANAELNRIGAESLEINIADSD